MRQFYLAYPELTGVREILHAVRGELKESPQKGQKKLVGAVGEAVARDGDKDGEGLKILHAVRGELKRKPPKRL